MEFMVRRWLEAGLDDLRANPDKMRSAMSLDRHDLNAKVDRIEDGGIVTIGQNWPYNLFGRRTVGGAPVEGGRLVMLDGDAADEEWAIGSTIGDRIVAIDDAGDPVDLAAAGVAAGDHYSIRDPQHERAHAWFAETAIPVTIGWPLTVAESPCLTVSLNGSQEQDRPVGNFGRFINAKNEGPPKTEMPSSWHETIQIGIWTNTQDSCLWLYRAVEFLYRDSINYFERIFERAVSATGADVHLEDHQPASRLWVRSFTISGIIEKVVIKTAREGRWHQTSTETRVVNTSTQRVETPPRARTVGVMPR